ncbi:MAG: hypothetical protein HY883_05135 [Deltaproteobacteria bacterium]|nr:hypothetical protein [Deltaproteobacteria bacterium]
MNQGENRIINLLSRALPVLLFSLLIVLLSNPLFAGEYHSSSDENTSGQETLACAQCHTMHGTQGGVSLLYQGSAPNGTPKLLRATSILNLCLYCHGETNPGAIDDAGRVPPQIMNNQMDYIPSAGDFKNRGGSSTLEGNRHSIGANVSGTPPPGYTGTWSDITARYSTTFNCLYCHDQHGNTNFRNLRYSPGNPSDDSRTGPNRVDITYKYDSSADPDDNTKDVNYWGGYANVSPYNKFTRSRVRFRRAPLDNDSPKRGIAAFCGKCHVNFYGVSGDANMGGTPAGGGTVGFGDNNIGNPWQRHPVTDIDLSVASNNNLHADLTNWGGVASKTRYIDPTSESVGDDQPFCLTCHYAHGGGNPNKSTTPSLDHTNLVFFDGAGRVNLDPNFDTSTGRIRNLCEQCHNQ